MGKADRLSGIAFFVLAVLIIWESNRSLPLGTLHNPGPGYMPTLLALSLAALSVLIALLGRNSPAVASLGWGEGRHALAILAACGFCALCLERLGFRLTMFLLLVFILGVLERLKPITVSAIAAALSLGSFWFFHNLLRVPLPLGPLGF